MNLQSKTFYSCNVQIFLLHLITNKTSFANTFSDEKPAGNLKKNYYQQSNLILILQITTHLGHDHGIDGHLAHAGRGPLEGKGVSYKSCSSLYNLQ